ncbi:MAG: hypothetical protein HUJ93_03630, partial [Bacteroidales bacterium]|nr:hypothetical protein [Bacteroidales bacterium]
MVTLFILLGLVYNSSATGFEQNPYAALWRKVETAMQDGKPQTASGYLEEIEKAAEKDGNLLEQLDAMAQRADCISQYNWKEYNIYNRKYLHLRDSVYNNLDENIERFANHPKVVILIEEKIERMLREARNKRPMEGKDFEKIREICRKTIDQFPRTQSAKRIQETIDSLEERYLTTRANTVLYPGDTSEIEISCRNIGQVKITQLLGDKIVKKVTVSDLKNEFAISETKKIKWNFPVEGEYVMLFEGGDKSCKETIYVSKIGFAYRRGKDGREIYVADLKTGRPYDEASVKVSSIDGRQKEHLVSQKEYSLDGFTKLNQKWDDKNQIKIRVEAGKDLSAAPLYPSEFYRNRSEHKEYDGCYIYTDRKLYKPTDTVQFKVIAWHISDNQGNVRTSQKVKVDLFAPGEKDPVASQIITTNDMGSASGAFTIPEGSKNGQYHISTDLNTAYFRIEEYKAPAFYAEMPKIDGLYGFDDVISQRGKVTSYAGYPVQGAKVEYTILRSPFWSRDCYQWFESENITRQSTATDENGEFSISFKALRPDVKGKLSAMFEVSVIVTDLQGNTISNMIMVPVSDMPVYMEAEFENEIDNGDFKVIDKNREKGVLITAFNNNGIRQEMNGEFELLSGDKCVLKGSFKSGERAMIDFKAIQSGEYTLKYSTVWRGKTFTSTKRYAIFDPGDKYSPTKDELFFSPVLGDEESVNFVLGTGKGNIWLEVELYDYTGRVFRKAVHLNSDMQKVSVKVPEKWCSYNEPLTLSVFGILNKKIVSRTHSFDRPSPSHS